MSDESCFKTCPACGGDGYVPTGGDDYVECPLREEALAYYEKLHNQQAALDAVREVMGSTTRYRHWKDDEGFKTASMVIDHDYGEWVRYTMTKRKLEEALAKAEPPK